MDAQEPPIIGKQEPNGGMNIPMDDIGQDSNFGDDENGEETTPKKQIQQLAGSLSQELRTYNDEQQQPDTELNKYVAGMVVKQASKALTDKDKDDVINKLNNASEDENGDIGDGNITMESVEKIANRVVNEILNNPLVSNERNRDDKTMRITKNHKNPFQSNR